MDTRIGLFSVKEKEAEMKSEGSVIFLDHLFTMEYSKLVQRIVTDVNVCACMDDAPQYKTKAIWDTGALTSCISDTLVRKMGLQIVDTGIGVTATGQTDIQYYFLDVHISDSIIIQNLKVAGFPLKNHDADFLIGMDIIKYGNLNICNSDGRTKITFQMNE